VIVTESALREQVRHPKKGARVSLPPGTTLSPAARDFVAHWQIEIVTDGSAEPTNGTARRAATWQQPSRFPVVASEAPRCTTCGSQVTSKPDRITQLNACHYVDKTHPRIRLRGKLDSLQATALLAASRTQGHPEVTAQLGVVAAYCRELVSAEYNERPAALPELDGSDEEAIHKATHDPRGQLGVDHVLPGTDHPELLHWLNLLRCQVREVELMALDAFPSPHNESGASIVHGLNRLSSVVYFVELLLCRDNAERNGAG
jgi:ethanolamine utilization cobalamin adenosyltransferase